MKKTAFTLIELLVVIAIIAVLMGILMPALRKVREQARQKACAAHIRQLVLGLNMYADDHQGRMPKNGGGSWFQDLGRTTINYLLASGMTPGLFYCPSNRTHNKKEDWDLFWIHSPHNLDDWDGSRFVHHLGGYSVAGYGFILRGSAGVNHINQYPTDEIAPEAIVNNRMKIPAARPMVVDLIMSQEAQHGKFGLEFGRITKGGLWINHRIWDTTSHLIRDDYPAGGNIGFLDGHVEWKKWSFPDYPPAGDDGKPLPRTNSDPAFYW